MAASGCRPRWIVAPVKRRHRSTEVSRSRQVFGCGHESSDIHEVPRAATAANPKWQALPQRKHSVKLWSTGPIPVQRFVTKTHYLSLAELGFQLLGVSGVSIGNEPGRNNRSSGTPRHRGCRWHRPAARFKTGIGRESGWQRRTPAIGNLFLQTKGLGISAGVQRN